MNSTRKRKIVTFEVDPRITHKASALAVKRGCTTAEVIRGWIEMECELAGGDLGKTGPPRNQSVVKRGEAMAGEKDAEGRGK